MTKRTVYRYKVYDIVEDCEKLSRHYASMKYIENIPGAVVIENSAIEVSNEILDQDERLNAEEYRDMPAT